MHMKNLLALLLFLPFTTFAQPSIVWENSFGGNATDRGTDLLAVENGNYLVLNMPYSSSGDVLNNHGGVDFWLLKLDPNGELLWQKCFGGAMDDEAQQIIPTPDGNYLLIGSTASNDGDISATHGQTDAWIIKIDPNGDIIWQKTYGGTNYDAAISITPAHDGGYVVAGISGSSDFDLPNNNHGLYDLWAFKIDEAGIMLWSKLYGGNYWDSISSVIATTDGGYIFAGMSESTTGDAFGNHGGLDSWIIKTDINGNKQWKKVLGGTDNDHCAGIIQADDGGYLVFNYCASFVGAMNGNHGGFDFWVYKLSASGAYEWQRFYGGTGWELGFGFKKLSNGNCIMLGQAQSKDGDVYGNLNPSAWMVCINQSGNVIWKKTYGGSASDTFVSVVELADGSLTVLGDSGSNDGDVQSGNGPQSAGDVWVVHFGSTTKVNEAQAELLQLEISPNPAKDYIQVHSKADFKQGILSILTLNGTVVMTQPIVATRKLDISALAAGQYLIRVESEGKVGWERWIKI